MSARRAARRTARRRDNQCSAAAIPRPSGRKRAEPADGGSSDDEEAWQRFKASDDAFKGMGDGSGMSMLKPGDFAWKNDPYQGRRAPGGGVGDAEHWDSTFREAHKPPPAGPPQRATASARSGSTRCATGCSRRAARRAPRSCARCSSARADYDVDAAAEAAGLPPASAAAEPPTRSAAAEAAGLPPASAAEAPSNGYDVNAAAERLARQTAPGSSSSAAAPAAEVERLEPEEEARLLAAARAEKEKGNEFFKAGDLAAALECYTEAIELCPSYVEERAESLRQPRRRPPQVWVGGRRRGRLHGGARAAAEPREGAAPPRAGRARRARRCRRTMDARRPAAGGATRR